MERTQLVIARSWFNNTEDLVVRIELWIQFFRPGGCCLLCGKGLKCGVILRKGDGTNNADEVQPVRTNNEPASVWGVNGKLLHDVKDLE